MCWFLDRSTAKAISVSCVGLNIKNLTLRLIEIKKLIRRCLARSFSDSKLRNPKPELSQERLTRESC